MKTYILDTNILYYLAEGKFKITDVIDRKSNAVIDPISIVEIGSKIDETKHFVSRSKAIEAITKYGISLIPTTQRVLVKMFGYEYARKPYWDEKINWMDVVRVLSSAKNESEFKAGIPSPTEGVVRYVSLDPLRSWRVAADGGWLNDMITLMRTKISSFSSWYDGQRTPGKKPYLKGEARRLLLADICNPDWFLTQLLCLQERAFLSVDRTKLRHPDLAHAKMVSAAIDHLSCYCLCYSEYVKVLLVEKAMPQENDSTDLELFLHLHNDETILVTAEKRWANISKKAGFSRRIHKVIGRFGKSCG